MVRAIPRVRVHGQRQGQESGVRGQGSGVRGQGSGAKTHDHIHGPECRIRIRVRVRNQDQGQVVRGQESKAMAIPRVRVRGQESG